MSGCRNGAERLFQILGHAAERPNVACSLSTGCVAGLSTDHGPQQSMVRWESLVHGM